MDTLTSFTVGHSPHYIAEIQTALEDGEHGFSEKKVKKIQQLLSRVQERSAEVEYFDSDQVALDLDQLSSIDRELMLSDEPSD